VFAGKINLRLLTPPAELRFGFSHAELGSRAIGGRSLSYAQTVTPGIPGQETPTSDMQSQAGLLLTPTNPGAPVSMDMKVPADFRLRCLERGQMRITGGPGNVN
jgi:hypothetical protein